MASTAVAPYPPAVQAALKACTPLQRRFVVEYCGRARGNATLAAKLAGIKPGKHKATLSIRASQLFREPDVQAAIAAWGAAYTMGGAALTMQLAELAEVNPGPFTDVLPDGTIVVRVRDDEAWEAHKHWVKAIEADPLTGRVTKVVLHDRLAVLDKLARILRLYSTEQMTNVYFVQVQQMSDAELLQRYHAVQTQTKQIGGGR